jgi:hypothetical protein
MGVIGLSMVVYAVDDARLGEISTVNDCCFVVSQRGRQLALRHDSVFNVVDNKVTLICMPAEAARYTCKAHCSSA